MDYISIFQHMILLFVNRIEIFYAIHCFCSIICLFLTMHRYVRWLLNYYQPLLTARHLSKWDMMSLTNEQQTSNLSIGLKQIPSTKGSQWMYKKWNFSFAANQSYRQYMEDRMSYVHYPQTHNISMFSIFDGHGGAGVADYLEQNFNRRIVRMLEEKEQRFNNIYSDDALIEQSLIDEVERIDADLSFSKFSTSYTGSTLISALVDHNRYLTIINVGDSRAIGSDLQGNCIPLSVDHKPDSPSERQRIEDAGGFVAFWGVERVQGILAVSRAFGDTELKRNRFVISTPEIRRIDLNKQPLRYIILASDGFWDVVSSHEAILEVNYLLEKDAEFSKLSEFEKQLSEDDEKVEDLSKATLLDFDILGDKVPVDNKPVTKSPEYSEVKSAEPILKKLIESPTRKTADLAVFQTKSPLTNKNLIKPKEESTSTNIKPEICISEAIEQIETDDFKDDSLTESNNFDKLNFKPENIRRTSDSSIISVDLKTGQQQIDVASHLVKLAVKRRSPDNISVFFVRLDRF